MKYQIGTIGFTLKGKKIVPHDGELIANAKFLFDGDKKYHYGVVFVSPEDSYELGGAMIFTQNSIIYQGDTEDKKEWDKISKGNGYKYKITNMDHNLYNRYRDHHVDGDTGWSL